MGRLLDWLFKFCIKNMLVLGRKPVPKNKEVNPRHWQVRHGRTLTDLFNKVIRRCHMLDDFWLMTRPDQDLFVLNVFRLDGPEKVIQLQIAIGFPDKFVISRFKENGCLAKDGEFRHSSFEQLVAESESALLEVLFQRSSIKYSQNYESRRI